MGVTITGPIAAVRGDANGGSWASSFWVGGGIDNYPDIDDDVMITDAGSYTISFNRPVLSPVLAILSPGDSGTPVSLTFGQAFSIVNTDGMTGLSSAGLVLTGLEGLGAIRFSGVLSQITFSSDTSEFYHSYQIGVDAADGVPEPSAFILAGAGLASILALRRRRQTT